MATLTDEELFKLIEAARSVQKHSYSPYSEFSVGAAVLTRSGQVYSGTNVETAHYKGICAEASALSAMISAGERKVRAVTIIAQGDMPAPPCGDCRQRLREFSNDETVVYVLNADGSVAKNYTVDELLPDSFGPDHLKSRSTEET